MVSAFQTWLVSQLVFNGLIRDCRFGPFEMGSFFSRFKKIDLENTQNTLEKLIKSVDFFKYSYSFFDFFLKPHRPYFQYCIVTFSHFSNAIEKFIYEMFKVFWGLKFSLKCECLLFNNNYSWKRKLYSLFWFFFWLLSMLMKTKLR